MKRFLLLFIIGSVLTSCGGGSDTGKNEEKLSGDITLSGAFALYPIAVKWGQEFKKLHPDVRVDVSAGGAGKGMADMLSGNVTIGMLSRDIHENESQQGAFSISVAKDAVIPTINSKNPALPEILKKGLTRQNFIDIWITEKVKTWDQIAGPANKDAVKVYTRSDAAGAPETWAKYLGKKQEDLKGVGIFGDPGQAEAVKKDINGIGFNNVVYAFDMKTKAPYDGLTIIPIDLNEDGKIDANENFYTQLDSLTSAIAKGKYPSPPSRELFFVTKGKPTDKLTIEFLKWVLTDGQKYLTEAGYVELSKEKAEAEKAKLN